MDAARALVSPILPFYSGASQMCISAIPVATDVARRPSAQAQVPPSRYGYHWLMTERATSQQLLSR
jgi:hypothetical protein